MCVDEIKYITQICYYKTGWPLNFIASQARSIYQYKNIRFKVLKCCADISFSRQYLAKKKIISNYANIKVPVTFPASRVRQNKIHTIRLKDEIKFVCRKKEKLNKELYYANLKAGHEWGNSWSIILDSVHGSINNEMEKKCKTINQKMEKLEGIQTSSYEHAIK